MHEFGLNSTKTSGINLSLPNSTTKTDVLYFGNDYLQFIVICLLLTFVIALLFVPIRMWRASLQDPSQLEVIPRALVAAAAPAAAVMSLEFGVLQASVDVPIIYLVPHITFVSAFLCTMQLMVHHKAIMAGMTARLLCWHILQGILGGNIPLLTLYATESIGFPLASMLIFTAPLWTALFGTVLGIALWSPEQVALALTCSIGVNMIWGGRKMMVKSSPTPGGVLAALCVALFNAASVILCNTKLRGQPPALVSNFMMLSGLVCALIVLLLGAPTLEAHIEITVVSAITQLTTVAQIIVVSTLLTITNELRNAGICNAKSLEVANMFYLELVFINIFGLSFLTAPLDPLNIVGTFVIIISCIVSAKLPGSVCLMP